MSHLGTQMRWSWFLKSPNNALETSLSSYFNLECYIFDFTPLILFFHVITCTCNIISLERKCWREQDGGRNQILSAAWILREHITSGRSPQRPNASVANLTFFFFPPRFTICLLGERGSMWHEIVGQYSREFCHQGES